ncbi:hypothetical protein ABZ476_25895, partial [Streptomyces albogriseolus]
MTTNPAIKSSVRLDDLIAAIKTVHDEPLEQLQDAGGGGGRRRGGAGPPIGPDHATAPPPGPPPEV